MKMKKIYQAILLGTITMSFTACSLDIDPISDATEITEGTSSQVGNSPTLKNRQAALDQRTNLYNLLRDRQEHWSLDKKLIADSHSDNAYAGTTGAEVVPFETNSIDPSNSVLSRDWNRYLEDIAKSNVLIVSCDSLLKHGLISDAENKQWKAEGKIFRAMVMFEMARLWGSFPLITTLAETITYDNIDEVYPTYFPPKSTREECYAQIVSDLEEGEKYAPDHKPEDRTVMSKVVAQAMLTKVYAELHEYDKVIAYAEKVRSATGMQLEPDFATLWTYDAEKKDCVKHNTSESILEVTNIDNWEVWMYTSPENDPGFWFTWAKWITPSRDLVNAFNAEGDVVRYEQTVAWLSCDWSNYYPESHYAFMNKCRSNRTNRYMLRLPDIILLEAEAYAEQGNGSKAAELVNIVRDRAKLTPVNGSGDMKETVLKERRLELALEGERWFDLVRTGNVEKYMNNVYSKDNGRLAQKRTFDENCYLLPIPQTALDENVNLEQNPGY